MVVVLISFLAFGLQARGEDIGGPCPDIVRALEASLARDARSRNLEAIEKFLAGEKTHELSVLETKKPIEGVGQLRLRNDLKTGYSTVEILDPPNGPRVIFNSKLLPPRERWGRVRSLGVTDDKKQIVIDYRGYGAYGSSEIRIDLASGRRLAPEGPEPNRILWNYNVIQVHKLPEPKAEVSLIDYGMNASQDVELWEDGARKIIFSSFDEKKNGRTLISSVEPSPRGDFIAIASSKDGSIDDYELRVYDRANNRMLDRIPRMSNYRVAWAGEDLIFKDPEGKLSRFRKGHEITGQKAEGLSSADKIALIEMEPGTGNFVIVQDTGKRFPLPSADSLVGKIGNRLYYLQETPERASLELRSLELGEDPRSSRLLVPGLAGEGYFLKGASRVGEYLILNLRKGKTDLQVVLDKDGKTVGRFVVPECCSVTSTSWKEGSEGKLLDVSFSSAVQSNVVAQFDLTTGKFSEPGFERSLMSRDGRNYVSEIVTTRSADGTQVPMRITRRADLKGKHPTLMTVYGGFNSPSPNYNPAYDSLRYRFLRDGGVLAAPAPRGGGDFDKAWADAGRKQNKPKTYEDIIASAHYLISNGIADGKGIIITGESAGGLSAAEAAVKDPASFGLSIPISGPLVEPNSISLDPDFNGFPSEYGDPGDPETVARMKRISPAESVKNGSGPLPTFFVVAGEKDTRVNPKHSKGFYAALRKRSADQPSPPLMLVTRNSGHMTASPKDERSIGWYTKSMIWARIYDYLGWTFKP